MDELRCRTEGDHGGEYRVVSGAYACLSCAKTVRDELLIRRMVIALACCFCGKVEQGYLVQGHDARVLKSHAKPR